MAEVAGEVRLTGEIGDPAFIVMPDEPPVQSVQPWLGPFHALRGFDHYLVRHVY